MVEHFHPQLSSGGWKGHLILLCLPFRVECVVAPARLQQHRPLLVTQPELDVRVTLALLVAIHQAGARNAAQCHQTRSCLDLPFSREREGSRQLGYCWKTASLQGGCVYSPVGVKHPVALEASQLTPRRAPRDVFQRSPERLHISCTAGQGELKKRDGPRRRVPLSYPSLHPNQWHRRELLCHPNAAYGIDWKHDWLKSEQARLHPFERCVRESDAQRRHQVRLRSRGVLS
mmetsp:Transcript_36144/g.90239  ORF Transcript_36144/g.90239 Transcript_36144/m.90239 type:complete len:231 (+) Transcript_36144:5223-5915(+)